MGPPSVDISGVSVRRLARHVDGRGWLAEIFRSDELSADLRPEMGYVSVTLPGHARGPHEHRHQTDIFCFPGPGDLDLYLWDGRGGEAAPRRHVLRVGASNPAVVMIPPGVVHAYRAVGEQPALVLNFANRLYAGPGRREPVDEIRHEDRPGSPYVLEAG